MLATMMTSKKKDALALNTRSIADRRTAMSAPAVSARAMARTVSHLATVLRYASSSSIAALTIFDDVCVALDRRRRRTPLKIFVTRDSQAKCRV